MLSMRWLIQCYIRIYRPDPLCLSDNAFDVDHCGVNCATRPTLLSVVISLCHYVVAAPEEVAGTRAQRNFGIDITDQLALARIINNQRNLSYFLG